MPQDSIWPPRISNTLGGQSSQFHGSHTELISGVVEWHVSGVRSDSHIDQWFDRLEQNGVTAVVWFLFGDGRGALTFDPSGYVRGVAPSFWADYHSVLAAAERHRLKVVWVVTDFEIGYARPS